jgi:hypothetical protein
MKRLFVLGIAFITAMGLSSCSQRIGDFTLLSTKNAEIGQKYVRVSNQEKVVGIDSKPIIVIIPMGTPNIKEAVDRALEKYGAQVLTNVVVYYDYYYIPYIYGEMKYRVEGEAWKKVDSLSGTLKEDLENSEAVFALKESNGQRDFIPVAKTDKVVQQVK